MTYSYSADVNVPQDVMVDLETRGTGPGCAILSIGAVAFDPKTGLIGREFYSVVSAASCRALGLREEAGTMAWWAKQSDFARAVLGESEASETTLEQALDGLTRFLRAHGGRPSVRVWGNGADFDNAILADLYRRVGQDAPWQFWNSRCFRTLKAMNPGREPGRTGAHHNALDDARHQAIWALRILRVPAEAAQ